MNRHIYGLTVFLIIVKIHFLLYWLFFAPVNFISTQVPEYENQPSIISTDSSNPKSAHLAELRNIAVNPNNGMISARIKINLSTTQFDVDRTQFAILIIDEDKNQVWQSEFKFLGSNKNQTDAFFIDCSRTLSRLNPNKNYYAKISVLPLSYSNVRHDSLTLDELTPVLLVKDTPKFSCNYGSGVD